MTAQATTPEVQSGEPVRRPYVVLEETSLRAKIKAIMDESGIELDEDDWSAVAETITVDTVYQEVVRVPSRNAAHALTQAGRHYERGTTPPLVAVSERMFKPRRVTVDFEPKVTLS